MDSNNQLALRGQDQVTVVVVTYGDRWAYLSRVLGRLNSDSSVSHIVLIDNASKYSVHDNCRDSFFDKITVYRNASNLGSAGGFSKGITIASHMDPELILLLDDDVVPKIGSIESLIKTYHRVNDLYPDSVQAVTAYRFCQYGKLLVPIKPIPYQNHSSFGLNIFNFIHRHILTTSKELKTVTEIDSDLPRLGTAYAGLLFSKQTVKIIGVPRPDFVLYYDDIEYSLRIINCGGNIWLDIGSEFLDICDNASTAINSKPFTGFILNKSDTRTYYLIRNIIYVEKYCLHRRSIYYVLNFIIYFTLLIIISILMFKISRSMVILSALRDGMIGKLDLNPRFMLE